MRKSAVSDPPRVRQGRNAERQCIVKRTTLSQGLEELPPAQFLRISWRKRGGELPSSLLLWRRAVSTAHRCRRQNNGVFVRGNILCVLMKG